MNNTDTYSTYLRLFAQKKKRIEAEGFDVLEIPMDKKTYENQIIHEIQTYINKKEDAPSPYVLANAVVKDQIYMYSDSTIRKWQKALENAGLKDILKLDTRARMQGLPDELLEMISQYKKDHPDWKPQHISQVFFGSK